MLDRSPRLGYSLQSLMVSIEGALEEEKKPLETVEVARKREPKAGVSRVEFILAGRSGDLLGLLVGVGVEMVLFRPRLGAGVGGIRRFSLC